MNKKKTTYSLLKISNIYSLYTMAYNCFVMNNRLASWWYKQFSFNLVICLVFSHLPQAFTRAMIVMLVMYRIVRYASNPPITDVGISVSPPTNCSRVFIISSLFI